MHDMNLVDMIELLRREVRPALGCTEPAAVALACAYAAQGVAGTLDSIEVLVDPNVYKNGMGVYVPGTDQVGLAVAAALGACIAKPEMELEVLRAVTAESRKKAFSMLERGAVTVRPDGDFGQLRIFARVISGDTESSATITGSHTNLTALYRNGHEVFSKPVYEKSSTELDWLRDKKIKDIFQAFRGHGKELAFLLELARQNLDVAREGMSRRLGVGLGFCLNELINTGKLGNDMANRAMCFTAAAADARMSGLPQTVISTNGSGNQGLTASIPLVVVAVELSSSEEELAEALAISHLTTIFVKQHIGKLSASCACAMAAAIGASCGTAYLLGHSIEQIEDCVGIMAANLTGMICDGAKVSCSFKLGTAVCTAVQAALLVGMEVSAPAGDGIIAATAEDTIRNLGSVSNPGMRETDRVILGLMCKNGVR